MATTTQTNYLSGPEFARRIGIHIQTVRYWDRTGKLTAHHKTPGGRRFYTEEQVEQFLSNNSNVNP